MSDFLARLDARLAELGLTSEAWLLSARKFRGAPGGRGVEGNLSARTRSRGDAFGRRDYAGHRLSLELLTPLAGRLIVFPPGGLRSLVGATNRWFGLRELALPPPLDHLRVWTADAEWALALLRDEEAMAALLALFPAGNLPSSVALQARPGRWFFSVLGHGDWLIEALPHWLDALCGLAARAEALPGPSRPYQPGWLERHPLALLASVGCALVAVAGIVALTLVLFAMLVS